MSIAKLEEGDDRLIFFFFSDLRPIGIGSSIGCFQTFQSLHLAIIFIAATVVDIGWSIRPM
jgi:hypothetical protein